MNTENTFFAPAGRASAIDLQRAAENFLHADALGKILEGLPDYAMVLNRHRQVVACNSLLLETFGYEGITEVLGKRPGEIVGCINAGSGPDGCGTDVHCSTCRAVTAIIEAFEQQHRTSHECTLILGETSVAIDLLITCMPINVEGTELLTCILKDISNEKRRLLLERMFFHDVINMAGGIRGLAAALAEGWLPPEKTAEYQNMMFALADRLLEEIGMQRKLVAAEKGDFTPDLGLVSVPKLMQELEAIYSNHDIGKGRRLLVNSIPDARFISDRSILCRIIGNLVKNGLEATPEGGTVTLSADDDGNKVIFSVNNPGIIPPEVQLQLFRRSFTTKDGDGRGLGTYCVRLFGERYLKGKVDFSCCESKGTTFSFTIYKNTFMSC